VTLGQSFSLSPGKEARANHFQKTLPRKLQGLAWAVAENQTQPGQLKKTDWVRL